MVKFTVINRAPIMTVWSFVVAERLGFQREEALSIGMSINYAPNTTLAKVLLDALSLFLRIWIAWLELTSIREASVYTEMNAISKGVSLGIYGEGKRKGIEASKDGSQPYVDLMGRRYVLHLFYTSSLKFSETVLGSFSFGIALLTPLYVRAHQPIHTDKNVRLSSSALLCLPVLTVPMRIASFAPPPPFFPSSPVELLLPRPDTDRSSKQPPNNGAPSPPESPSHLAQHTPTSNNPSVKPHPSSSEPCVS